MSMDSPQAAVIGAARLPSNVEHLSVQERVARGRAARKALPRRVHADFRPGSARPDPIELLEGQAEARVTELVPIRYGRMLVSPLTFYRGAALIMASDLSDTPNSGLHTQLCGDAHLSNFGIFGTPERRLVFDINDFDETLPGPFEWDVKRLAASFALAGRNNGFSEPERDTIVRACVAQYRSAMAEFASMGNLQLFYTSFDVEQLLAPYRKSLKGHPQERAMNRNVDRLIAKARNRDNVNALDRFTQVIDGGRRIMPDPPLITPIRDLLDPEAVERFLGWGMELLRQYRNTLATDRRRLVESYRIVDAARKVVGVGSVGTRAWVVLLMGRDDRDPLMLQFKEAPASVLERYLGRSRYRNGGHRVVAGQRLMQAVGDVFLGWIRLTGPDGLERDFYVRQLRDWKGSAEVEQMVPEGMRIYAELCGWTLARAHARSGDRVAIAAYLGNSDAFDRTIAAFAEVYADQSERDHAALAAAAADGRIEATPGL
jgi:uncharacterized protein (DUF2252 family)